MRSWVNTTTTKVTPPHRMGLHIKKGVRFLSAEMAMMHATIIVNEVAAEMGVDCTITCGKESHEDPSKHLLGALDYRTRMLKTQERKMQFEYTIRLRLNEWFYVLLESDHLHIQYPIKGQSV